MYTSSGTIWFWLFCQGNELHGNHDKNENMNMSRNYTRAQGLELELELANCTEAV